MSIASSNKRLRSSRFSSTFNLTRGSTTWSETIRTFAKPGLLEFSPGEEKLYEQLVLVNSDGEETVIPTHDRTLTPKNVITPAKESLLQVTGQEDKGPPELDEEAQITFQAAEDVNDEHADLVAVEAIVNDARPTRTTPRASSTMSVRKGTPMPGRAISACRSQQEQGIQDAAAGDKASSRKLSFSPASQHNTSVASVEVLEESQSSTPKSGSALKRSRILSGNDGTSAEKMKRRISKLLESSSPSGSEDEKEKASFVEVKTPDESASESAAIKVPQHVVSILDDFAEEIIEATSLTGKELLVPAASDAAEPVLEQMEDTSTSNDQQGSGVHAGSKRRQLAENKLELFRQSFLSLQRQMEDVKNCLFDYLEAVKPE